MLVTPYATDYTLNVNFTFFVTRGERSFAGSHELLIHPHLAYLAIIRIRIRMRMKTDPVGPHFEKNDRKKKNPAAVISKRSMLGTTGILTYHCLFFLQLLRCIYIMSRLGIVYPLDLDQNANNLSKCLLTSRISTKNRMERFPLTTTGQMFDNN